MLYLANPCGEEVVAKMLDGTLGFIDTPAQGNLRPPGVAWCADNGCFSKKWDEVKWWRFLVKNRYDLHGCLFATAPDVVGDARATLELSRPWLPKIRELGYEAALVAQDGLESLPVPWDEFDCLFIGGTTEWKLSDVVVQLVAQANERHKWVHLGRVNSKKRYQWGKSIGCDSADGTFLTFGPKVNLPKLLRWFDP